MLCLFAPEPMASNSTGLALPQGGPEEPQGLVILLSGYYRSGPCIFWGVVPPLVIHLLRCHAPGCYTSLGIVLCLHGYYASGYHVSTGIRHLAVCAALIVVSPGIMLLGVMPPWMSRHWVLCFFGYFAFWDIMPWGILPPGTVLP